MTTRKTPISDEAVLKATGKTWGEWFSYLKKEVPEDYSHKEIVKHLEDKNLISSYWWCQAVTGSFERWRGKKEVGQVEGAGFQIGVQRTFPISAANAWDLLTKSPGRHLWLGKISRIRFAPGTKYCTVEGTEGEIRSVEQKFRIRMTWKPKTRPYPSTLQITLVENGDKTSIRFHHEKLLDQQDREQMRDYWKEVLLQLDKRIKGK